MIPGGGIPAAMKGGAISPCWALNAAAETHPHKQWYTTNGDHTSLAYHGLSLFL